MFFISTVMLFDISGIVFHFSENVFFYLSAVRGDKEEQKQEEIEKLIEKKETTLWKVHVVLPQILKMSYLMQKKSPTRGKNV